MPGQSGENRIDLCVECGEQGEITTQSGLCDTCYRRLRRQMRKVDRHSTQRGREISKVLRLHADLVGILYALGADRELVRFVLDAVQPLLRINGERVTPSPEGFDETED